MKFDTGAVIVIVSIMILLGLQSCTAFNKQTELREPVQKMLGRELKIPEEVDVRDEVVGLGIYAKCSENIANVIFGFPFLMGCAKLSCGEDKEWETPAPCTCSIYRMVDNERNREHELNHCRGYGEY